SADVCSSDLVQSLRDHSGVPPTAAGKRIPEIVLFRDEGFDKLHVPVNSREDTEDAGDHLLDLLLRPTNLLGDACRTAPVEQSVDDELHLVALCLRDVFV